MNNPLVELRKPPAQNTYVKLLLTPAEREQLPNLTKATVARCYRAIAAQFRARHTREGTQVAAAYESAANALVPTLGSLNHRAGAPTGVTATAGAGEATVTWTAPADAGVPALTTYLVTVSPGNAQVWVPAGTVSTVVSNLAPGTAYTFVVQALNTMGISVPSAASNAVVPTGSSPTLPGAPTGVTASLGSPTTTVHVAWTAPSELGSPALLGYLLTAHGPGAPVTLAVPSTVTSVDWVGLTAGVSYTFSVHGYVTLQSTPGAESAASNTVTPVVTGGFARVPQPPTNVHAVAGNAQATVSWAAPVDPGSSAIIDYTATAVAPGTTAAYYTSNATGTYQVYRIDEHGLTSPVQITSDATHNHSFVQLHPYYGSALVLCNRSLAADDHLDATKTVDLVMIDTFTGNPIAVVATKATLGWSELGHGEWSPDGSEIVVYGRETSSTDYLIAVLDPFTPDTIKREIARRATSVGICLDPAWSFDGQHIVYIARMGGSPTTSGIYRADAADGANKTLILAEGASRSLFDPQPSPSGDVIAFLDWEGGIYGWSLKRVNWNGTGETAILTAAWPYWYGEGKWLNDTVLFTHSNHGPGLFGIYRVNRDGTGFTVVIDTTADEDTPGVWGPSLYGFGYGTAQVTVSGLTGTVTGLTNGIAYTFTVTARNGTGSSTASAPSNSVTPSGAGPPGIHDTFDRANSP